MPNRARHPAMPKRLEAAVLYASSGRTSVCGPRQLGLQRRGQTRPDTTEAGVASAAVHPYAERVGARPAPTDVESGTLDVELGRPLITKLLSGTAVDTHARTKRPNRGGPRLRTERSEVVGMRRRQRCGRKGSAAVRYVAAVGLIAAVACVVGAQDVALWEMLFEKIVSTPGLEQLAIAAAALESGASDAPEIINNPGGYFMDAGLPVEVPGRDDIVVFNVAMGVVLPRTLGVGGPEERTSLEAFLFYGEQLLGVMARRVLPEGEEQCTSALADCLLELDLALSGQLELLVDITAHLNRIEDPNELSFAMQDFEAYMLDWAAAEGRLDDGVILAVEELSLTAFDGGLSDDTENRALQIQSAIEAGEVRIAYGAVSPDGTMAVFLYSGSE